MVPHFPFPHFSSTRTVHEYATTVMYINQNERLESILLRTNITDIAFVSFRPELSAYATVTKGHVTTLPLAPCPQRRTYKYGSLFDTNVGLGHHWPLLPFSFTFCRCLEEPENCFSERAALQICGCSGRPNSLNSPK